MHNCDIVDLGGTFAFLGDRGHSVSPVAPKGDEINAWANTVATLLRRRWRFRW